MSKERKDLKKRIALLTKDYELEKRCKNEVYHFILKMKLLDLYVLYQKGMLKIDD